MGRPKGSPFRGASRDRTLPGKARRHTRRFIKWHEKNGEQGLYEGMTLREIAKLDEPR